MKRILLASASIVAFAGAAAAESHSTSGITFSGDATLGYNDTQAQADPVGDDDLGFYWDAGIDVTMSAALDNGLTASASFGLDIVDGALSDSSVSSGDYVLSLTSDTAGLYFGNTEFAAVTHWVSAGDMHADLFSEEDGETVLRGDITYGGVNASVSYAVDSANDTLEQLSLGADATFGTVSVAFGYQEATTFVGGGDFYSGEVIGVSVGTSLGGADIRLAYANDSVDSTIAVKVSYPVGGGLTVAVSYASEEFIDDYWSISADYASGAIAANVNFDSEDDWELTGSYDVGNGITAYAGVVDAGDDMYVAGSVALGEGASLLVSYVDEGDNDDDDDEVGPNDYKEGATVELGFSF